MITTLRTGNNIAISHKEIVNEVDSYYSHAFGETPARAHSIDLSLLQLPSVNQAHLEEPFTKDEVEKVVKSMPPDKAPGPDGLAGRFFATCWHIIKGDLMRAMDSFYHGDMRGLPESNKAIVLFLPKKDGAVDIRDFSSVSLVHGAIEIFDKVLSNRLATDLPLLVGKHQSAFVKG